MPEAIPEAERAAQRAWQVLENDIITLRDKARAMPKGREQALVITKLEEAALWAKIPGLQARL